MATAAVRTSPNSFKTHKLLAAVLYESDPDHSNIDRVIAEADKSMALLDSLPDARNLADAYLWPGAYHLVKGDQLRQPGPDGVMVSSPGSIAQYNRAREVLLRSIAIDRSARAEYHRQLETSRGNSVASLTRAGNVETFRTPSEAERLLSEVYLRLGDPADALSAATRSSELDPLSPEAYREIAEALLVESRADDAAAKLMAGLLITSDPGLSRLLKKASATAKDRVESPVQTVENKQWSKSPVFMVFRGPQAPDNRPGGLSHNTTSTVCRPSGTGLRPVRAFFSSLLEKNCSMFTGAVSM